MTYTSNIRRMRNHLLFYAFFKEYDKFTLNDISGNTMIDRVTCYWRMQRLCKEKHAIKTADKNGVKTIKYLLVDKPPYSKTEKVFECIENHKEGQFTSRDITDCSKITLSNISFLLTSMQNAKLVDCIKKEGVSRHFAISNDFKNILKRFKHE